MPKQVHFSTLPKTSTISGLCQLTKMDEDQLKNRFRGVILGTAAGDALGLPAEGISPKRAGKLFKGRWQHRFVGGRGMVSDDTDHTVLVAQSILKNPDSPELFAKALSRCLRWWLLSIPAGIGLATLRSIIRLIFFSQGEEMS